MESNKNHISSHEWFERAFNRLSLLEKRKCDDENKDKGHVCRICCNIYDENHVTMANMQTFHSWIVGQTVGPKNVDFIKGICIIEGLIEWFGFMSLTKIRATLSGDQKYLDDKLKSFHARDFITRKCAISAAIKDMDLNILGELMARKIEIIFV